jgi:hypothetical protein
MWRERETTKVLTGFWWGYLKEIAHLEDLGVDVKMILKWIFKEWDGEAWTGLIWFRIGAGGGLL